MDMKMEILRHRCASRTRIHQWFRWRTVQGLSLLLGTALWGCTNSTEMAGENPQTVPESETAAVTFGAQDPFAVPSSVAELPDYEGNVPEDDPRQLSDVDINNGPGSLRLGVSELLREIGVVELLDRYIVNVPPTAKFIAQWEANKASISNHFYTIDTDVDSESMRSFESAFLRFAQDAMTSLPLADNLLHEAFYEVLEQCGRASAWPDVELFMLHEGRGGDMMSHLIEPTFGLTYFEYQQLRHQCARYAATYPTLDPTLRDELLAPQRAHYARVVMDRLDNELPIVKVPPEYQDEIDELRANGW